jgi:hypothetical protein
MDAKKLVKLVMVVGKNVYPFLKSSNGVTSYNIDGATIELIGKTYELGLNQTYHTLMEDNNLPGRSMKKYRGEILLKKLHLADLLKKRTCR